MRIDRLTFAELLLFGADPIAIDFKRFNLLIGRNGSGKSSIFRLLALQETEVVPREEIEIEHRHLVPLDVESVEVLSDRFYYQHGSLSLPVGTASFIGTGMLRIDYANQNADQRSILFQQRVCVEGDLHAVRAAISQIGADEISAPTRSHVKEIISSWEPSRLSTFNFALKYTLQLSDAIMVGGDLEHVRESVDSWDKAVGGSTGGWDKYPHLSSGQLASISLLLRIVGASQSVILIDEPERCLEPGTLRRLTEVLIWLCFKSDPTSVEIPGLRAVLDRVDRRWADWTKGDASAAPATVTPHQLMIASHSSVLLNLFLGLHESATIHRFDLYYSPLLPTHEERMEEAAPAIRNARPQRYLYSSIRPVTTEANGVLEALGVKGADLLQANGIVWVEGPSDIIYLHRWLELADRRLVVGRHFEFNMYGGALLRFLSLTQRHNELLKAPSALVSILAINRRAFVVMDSDVTLAGGVRRDRSSYRESKHRLHSEVLAAQEREYLAGVWYTPDDLDYPTIENYVDAASLREVGRRKKHKSKVVYAQQVVATWQNETDLSRFSRALQNRVHELAAMIRVWNE
jgi:ABC-type dipeptide/oligopeptide/nickel transport system ATPase subunit